MNNKKGMGKGNKKYKKSTDICVFIATVCDENCLGSMCAQPAFRREQSQQCIKPQATQK